METLASYEIPVEFSSPGQNMEIFSSSMSTVKLLVSGAGPLMKSLSPGQISVNVSLANTVAGRNQIAITPENISLPPGIRLKQIEPSTVWVSLDVPAAKELPVQADWVGTLQKGLVLETARIKPDVVKVTGPSLILKEMSTLFTEPIPLDYLEESGMLTVNLALNPASLKLDDPKKRSVTIHYVIARRTGSSNWSYTR